ncbi:hypothetical protein H311_05166, partial [Anncaliia algerae PRA109]
DIFDQLEYYRLRIQKQNDIEKDIRKFNDDYKERICKSNISKEDAMDLKENDIVLLKRPLRSNKLQSKFYGPFIIKEVLKFGTYIVRSLQSNIETIANRKNLLKVNENGKSEEFITPLEDETEFRRG